MATKKISLNELRSIVKQIIKEETEKYSYESKTIYGMEYLFAYPDKSGVETRDGLEKWEMNDSANRELQFVNNKKEALNKFWKDWNINEQNKKDKKAGYSPRIKKQFRVTDITQELEVTIALDY